MPRHLTNQRTQMSIALASDQMVKLGSSVLQWAKTNEAAAISKTSLRDNHNLELCTPAPLLQEQLRSYQKTKRNIESTTPTTNSEFFRT